MTTSGVSAAPAETLVTALAHLFAILTEHRGLVPDPGAAPLATQWPIVRQMPLDAPEFPALAALVYRLGVFDGAASTGSERAQTAAVDANRIDGGWLALRARSFFFVQPTATPRHPGITYSLAVVVATASAGQDSMAKLARARAHIQRAVDLLRRRRAYVTSARVVRLVYGRPAKRVRPPVQNSADVSTEVWYTDELQYDSMAHELVPPHRLLAQMTPAELAPIPAVSLRIARQSPDRLDVLLETDRVARVAGYVPGQLICIERAALLDGGRSFSFRVVA